MSLQGFYTTKGLALAAKLAAGTGLTLTRVTAGSGEPAASAAAAAPSMRRRMSAKTPHISALSAFV